MRISEIHIYQKNLPVVGGPYTMSRVTLDSIDTSIIKLVSDTGLTGWGEVAPLGPVYQPQHALGARAAISELAPNLIGQSALTPLLLNRQMDGLLNGHNYAKSAIDIAIMDLMGITGCAFAICWAALKRSACRLTMLSVLAAPRRHPELLPTRSPRAIAGCRSRPVAATSPSISPWSKKYGSKSVARLSWWSTPIAV